MEWTFANLIIQTPSGLIGSNIATAAAHEHHFGFRGQNLVRIVSGAIAMMAIRAHHHGTIERRVKIQEFASVHAAMAHAPACGGVDASTLGIANATLRKAAR